MKYPALIYDKGALCHNLNVLTQLCHRHGVQLAVVTKVICADKKLLAVINDSGADMLADSRVENLRRMNTDKPRLLLRIPMLSDAMSAVKHAEYCLVSETAAINALNAAAQSADRISNVILMVDLGDLREGIFEQNEALILRTARAVCEASNLRLKGVGANLTCFGAILPDDVNMARLCAIAEMLRKETKLPIEIVSGGNSSALNMLAQGRLPSIVNHLRLGESVFLGKETADGRLFDGLSDQVCTLCAEIVEVQRKPASPVGVSGANAFGETVRFTHSNTSMLRGILAIGRQDVDEKGLTCLDSRVSVLGASSDHLIVDLSEAGEYTVGDTLSFRLSYGALLRASTSKYVRKYYR